MEQKEGLIQWLNQSPLPEDFYPLSFSPDVMYMPIEVVRRKFDEMKSVFGATVEQTDVQTNAINTFNKDTLIWSSVKFKVYHKDFLNGVLNLSGTASFYIGQYSGSWSYAQISEALATVRAFSKEFKQFGRDSEKSIEGIGNLKSPTIAKKNDSVKNTMDKIGR